MSYAPWLSNERIKYYQANRFRNLDQKIIDKIEKKLVNNIFRKYGIRGTILDIPCGYGRFHPLLSNFGEIHIADIDRFIADYQNNEVGSAKSTTVCNANSTPFEDSSFEVVFCFRLMQHVHESDQRISIYKELNRISNKWILISVYERTALHSILKHINKKKARITFLSKSQVENEFTQAKLVPVCHRSILPALHGQKIYLMHKMAS